MKKKVEIDIENSVVDLINKNVKTYSGDYQKIKKRINNIKNPEPKEKSPIKSDNETKNNKK